MRKIYEVTKKMLGKKHEGLNGAVLAVGLCVVAVLICGVMNTSLGGYVTTVVNAFTTKTITMLGS